MIDAKETAYFSSRDVLYAVSPQGVLTEKQLPYPVFSPLTIDPQGRLYFFSEDFQLVCMGNDGTFCWDYPIHPLFDVASTTMTLPVFDADGHAYVGNSEGRIYCLDTQTGNCLWMKTVEGSCPIYDATSTSKGDVFFLAADGSVYRVRKPTFFERVLTWSFLECIGL